MGAMTHRRCIERKKRKLARRMMLSSSFRGRARYETACRSSGADVLASLTGLVNADATPDLEACGVLMDSRGEGSFQK
ncbi:MAG: hypothetical protein WBV70_02900 [Candidatus Bathyarchaeia archaeon]